MLNKQVKENIWNQMWENNVSLLPPGYARAVPDSIKTHIDVCMREPANDRIQDRVRIRVGILVMISIRVLIYVRVQEHVENLIEKVMENVE